MERFDFLSFELLPQRYEQLTRSQYDLRNILEQKFEKINVEKEHFIDPVVFYEEETIGRFHQSFWDDFFTRQEAEYMCLRLHFHYINFEEC